METAYKVLDLKNKSLASSPVKIDGIYAKIEGSYKGFLLKDFVIDGIERKPVYAPCLESDGDYLFDVGDYIITIDSDDDVTAEEKQTGGSNIPDAPTENGRYVLVVTSSGNEWSEET